MPVLRLFLIGYGAAATAALAVGMQSGDLAGWLTAWLGGAVLSLLIAYSWFRIPGANLVRPDRAPAMVLAASQGRGSLKGRDRGIGDVPAGFRPALLEAGPDEPRGSVIPFPARTGQPAALRQIRSSGAARL